MVSKYGTRWAEIPVGLEDWVANRQVSAHIRILNALTLGYLLNTAMIVIVFFGTAPTLPLALWAFTMTAMTAHRYAIGYSNRRNAARENPQAVVWHFDINSTILALLTAIGLIWLMPLGRADQQVFVGIAGSTMIAAAAYTMRTLARGALTYLAIVSAGMATCVLTFAISHALPTAVLVIASGMLLAQMVLTANKLFIVRILHDRDLNASAETVKMLLNDYHDQGSDWLFELDCDGSMVGVSQRFASALGRDAADLNGRSFFSLFDNVPERDQLESHVNERRAFRGLALPINKNMSQEKKWWSVSARAVPPNQGSIVRFRGVITDISQAKLADARVRHMAHYDGLTDLPNRTFFVSAINRQFQTMHQAKRLALLLVDVDHFKSVNDIYGHPIGDAFVKQVGQRIVQCTQTSGLGGEGHIVARLGGDEFAILMAGEDVLDHSIRLAELLVQTLAQPFTIGDHTINSSASLGIALAPDHANNAQMLQSNADIALYAAKNGGRNCWELFETGMDTAVQQRHAIERDLRVALTKKQLRLYFQPLINVETGLPTGFEALVRWEHPENGMVMPNDFIPIAESSGLIVPLGEWVIRTAMAEAVRWKEPHTIAVNLSPIQLRSANLLPTIVNALAETGLDPARLEVEITESVLLNDCEANIVILNRLHDLGIKIALDDFGTGYASLNYLRTFPFDKIKIDRSFVTELAERADCRAIVSAVISLANNLGMCTLAEGVESEEQLAALRSEGCSMVQGWLFGKAMPADHYSSLRSAPDENSSKPVMLEPQKMLTPRIAA